MTQLSSYLRESSLSKVSLNQSWNRRVDFLVHCLAFINQLLCACVTIGGSLRLSIDQQAATSSAYQSTITGLHNETTLPCQSRKQEKFQPIFVHSGSYGLSPLHPCCPSSNHWGDECSIIVQHWLILTKKGHAGLVENWHDTLTLCLLETQIACACSMWSMYVYILHQLGLEKGDEGEITPSLLYFLCGLGTLFVFLIGYIADPIEMLE